MAGMELEAEMKVKEEAPVVASRVVLRVVNTGKVAGVKVGVKVG